MKRPNITPGEWIHDRGLICFGEAEITSIGVKRGTICALAAPPDWIPNARSIATLPKLLEVMEANARAIASVPKLLEAMEELIPFADVDLEPDELTVEVPIEKLMKLKFALQEAGYTFD